MADIKQCIQPLQTVWELANIEWGKRYTDIYPLCISTYRSPEAQAKLYNQPFDKIDNDGDGKVDEPDEMVTRLKLGKHNKFPAEAFDFTFKSKATRKVYWNFIPYYQEFWEICKNIDPNLRWGGTFSFKDYGHIEYK